MAYYNNVGLLVLNKDQTKFLVCQKYPQYVTADLIVPGGQNDEHNDIECLKNEVKQELNCQVDLTSLELLGTYKDAASGYPERTVVIKLYRGELIGNPTPSTEIEFIHWIDKTAANNAKVSPIIKNKIIPDLVKRGILK